LTVTDGSSASSGGRHLSVRQLGHRDASITPRVYAHWMPDTSARTPEERELAKKRAELTALDGKLAERELDLVTLQAEIRSFAARYLWTVGRC